MTKPHHFKRRHHSDPDANGDHDPAPVATQEDDPAPEPLVAPPQPMGVAVLRVQKQRYRDWITAGGTPAIYT
jgi:hypothetical protein